MKDPSAHSGKGPHSIDQTQDPGSGERTLLLALTALRRKERTRTQLEEWLRDREVDDTDIAETIDRLIELGELDDARFARRYAEDKRELRGWGAERIRKALLARGIAPEEVEAALAEDDIGAEVERATAILRRHGSPVATEAERGRAFGYLTRRGYDYDVAYEAIRRHQRAA